MSGGVDSSVAACLLAEEGYDVLGSHMDLVHTDGVDHGCCGPRARADAAEVARLVGFRFEVVDLSAEFERSVLTDFVDEHTAGRTPNPCIRCNERIKFGAFLSRADALGIDLVATGHYVRTELDAAGRWRLFRGADPGKDQSYVLHTLGQRALSRSRFPVGALPKSETRIHAARFGLPVADKPDSQEVCFVPDANHAAFLEQRAPQLGGRGDVVDARSGEVVGSHSGTFRYTVGQRRGLGVSRPVASYVVELDAAANRVVIGPADLLTRSGLVADRMSWVAGEPPQAGPFEADVRIRYRGADIPAIVEVAEATTAVVRFGSGQSGVAPGQSVVMYRGDELLGGGRIVRSFR
jgi:tRNA-uridine 2-sulfurtransferase